MARANDNSAMDAEDEVRLYEDGWKDRYFRIVVDKKIKNLIVEHFVE